MGEGGVEGRAMCEWEREEWRGGPCVNGRGRSGGEGHV